MPKALITGITGQDGAYLARFLLDKGYEIYGAHRRGSELRLNNLRFLGAADDVNFVGVELLEYNNILRAIRDIRPNEVYNLGAQSFVRLSFDMPIFTADVTALGALRVLEAIREADASIRFYQASSSEMIGKSAETPQDESTPFHPRSPYAASKLFAHWTTVNYRESYDLFACSGILFNHESPLRGPEFVTRKISSAAARIKLGLQDELHLGNLDARRDWGFAGDYVRAMWMMLQQETPDDYVIATGQTHSVRDFVEAAFAAVDIAIDWQGEGADATGTDRATGKVLVRVDPKHFRPTEVDLLTGSAAKARAALGWQHEVAFEQLVEMMVARDLQLAEAEELGGIRPE